MSGWMNFTACAICFVCANGFRNPPWWTACLMFLAGANFYLGAVAMAVKP